MAIASCHLFVGDRFFIESHVKSLSDKISKQHKGEVSTQSFHLTETPFDEVMVQARNLPFLAEAQVFHIRDLKKLKKADVEKLASYCENPNESTHLVFEAEELEKTHALVKLLKKVGEVLYFEAKQERMSIQQFITQKLKGAGKTITPRAAGMVEESAGGMPSFLDTMLERLILFAEDKSQVDEKLVQVFEENFKKVDVFQITNAISEKNTSKALELTKEVLEHNEKDVISLLGVLHWQMRRLWLASALLSEGYSQGEMLTKCKISPRQAPYFTRQVKKFSRKKLEEAIEGLFQIDWKLKTGRTDGALALESWLLQVTH